MTPGWRRGGGDDRDNDGGDDGGHDGDDGYFCILRGSCGGAETTVAAAAGMCRTGDHTRTRTHTHVVPRLSWWSGHPGYTKVAGCCIVHAEVSLGKMLNTTLRPRRVTGYYS